MSHFASGMISAGSKLGDGPAPTFVSASANQGGSAALMPSGWAVGDLLMIFADSFKSGTTNPGHYTPAGWTDLGDWTNDRVSPSYKVRTKVFYRIAQSGDTTVTLVAPSGVDVHNSFMMSFRGVDPASPFEALEILSDQSATSTYPYAQITTLGGNRVVVQAVSTFYSGTSASSTPYTGWTELFDTGRPVCLAVDMRAFASAGLTSAGNQTRSSPAAYWGRMAFAIKPAPV